MLLSDSRIAGVLGCAAGLVLLNAPAWAAPAWGEVFDVRQPDGEQVRVRIWGDEFYRVVESLDGYTLVPDPKTGVACYARLSADGNELLSTGLRLGGDARTLGLSKNLRIRPAAARAKALAARAEAQARESKIVQAAGMETASAGPPSSGIVQGICLIVDFSDDPWTIPPSAINSYLNQPGYSGYGNNGSVRDYFHDVSDGALTYTNYVPAAYYRAQHPKTYYEDPNVNYGTRAAELIIEALTALENSGFDFSQYDANHDGYVDGINCLYAGSVRNAWAQGLWPHASVVTFRADGLYTRRYQITGIGNSLTLSTFCHENGHMLCYWPDLYDYGYESNGVGKYCLMCGSTSATNPEEPCAYLKALSNWSTVHLLSTPMSSLSLPASSTNVCYKFPHPSRSNEFYLIENRQKTGRDSGLPDAGMAIWHIDTQGSNDYEDMTFAKHYLVTLVQADGRWDLERDVNQGDATDLWAGPSYSACSPASNPNTHWWDGVPSGLTIRNISPSAPTMTFHFALSWDCNANGVPDDQDIAGGVSQDCNLNGTPDECDIASGLSDDCDHNGVPDSCQPDTDSDAVVDACDNCPAVVNPDQGNADSDGLGDACDEDDDNDGLADLADNCARAANPDQADADADGAGDACDLCPQTIRGAGVDDQGCPPLIVADFDRDGDVDQTDFGLLQRCLTGNLTPQADPTCAAMLLDNDLDVDSNDLTLFLRCLSRPNILGDPDCNP